MDIIVPLISFVLGGAAGAWGYRYMLKKDPEQLERWAAEIKAARRS